MIKLLIADDVRNVRESLQKSVLSNCPGVSIIALTDGVHSTVSAIKEFSPDIVLLDIEMKDGSGFEIFKSFPDPLFKVIFITAYKQYSIDAFKFSALDYLLKPVDPDHLTAAINRASKQLDREKASLKIDSFLHNIQSTTAGSKKVVLKTSESIHIVSLSDIVYCEADESYTNFHLADTTRIMVTKTLREFDEMFTNYNFVRIHQSYLVNLNYIKRYDKGEGGNVVLNNEKSLPVSVRKKEQLMQLLSKL
jgi:two-component system LytT family response regulator